MLTKAQEHLYHESLNKLKESHEKIKNLYEEFHNSMTTIPNNPIGLIFEDGIENKNPNYKIDIVTNIMHQIGYWNGIKANSEYVINLIRMSDSDFDDFLKQQKEIEKHNELERLRIKEIIEKRLDIKISDIDTDSH